MEEGHHPGPGPIGSGGVGNGGRAIINGNIVTIPLTNVANAQTIQVTLYGLYGSTDLVIPMSVLIGDSNGNGSVNASDVSQTKARVGQQMDATNFRSDVNANGYIVRPRRWRFLAKCCSGECSDRTMR